MHGYNLVFKIYEVCISNCNETAKKVASLRKSNKTHSSKRLYLFCRKVQLWGEGEKRERESLH
jgi:hypothetical protein